MYYLSTYVPIHPFFITRSPTKKLDGRPKFPNPRGANLPTQNLRNTSHRLRTYTTQPRMTAKKKARGQKATAKSAPAFDEAALSKLTAKLDTELSKPKSKEHKHKDERPSKRKRADTEPKDASPHPKKRHARGAGNGPGKPKKAPRDKRAEMLEEIKALGGDEADLDLVAGIDSDAEEGQEAKPGKSAPSDMDTAFKNDLAKFAAGLGFDNVRDEDGATDDEADEAAVSEAAGEGEWEDEAEDGTEQATEASGGEEDEAPPAEKLHGRGKLVSMRQAVS